MKRIQSQPKSLKALLPLISLIALAASTACAGPSRKSDSLGKASDSPTSVPAVTQESGDALKEIEKDILETDADLQPEARTASATTGEASPSARIPLEINEDVRRWITFFSVADRERFQRFLLRGEKYRTVIQQVLKKNGVPAELYYLGMIESGYATAARSHARAVGPWQFIRGTGQRYGLRADRTVDERMDIIRSTEAAARYLLGLHTAFQSWYLAMAGYNAGEGRILGAVVRNGTRDFWELVDQKKLPAETRNYVPKFLAAAIIGRHPEKYGFTDLATEKFPEVEGATVPGGVRLSSVASRIGVPAETLARINPHLLRGVTPHVRGGYQVWVPKGYGDRTIAEVSALEAESEHQEIADSSSISSNDSGRHSRGSRTVAATAPKKFHVIRRGETLYSIATRYQLTVASLKKLNRLKSNRIHVGMKLRVRGLNREEAHLDRRHRTLRGRA